MNISPDALTRAREEAGLSQRELARRVVELQPDVSSEGALQVRLSRLERGQMREVPDDLAEALGVALGFEDGDDPRHLAGSERWGWADLSVSPQRSLSLGFRELRFHSPERAYDARDQVAGLMGGDHPWRGAVLAGAPALGTDPHDWPQHLPGAPMPHCEALAFIVDDPSDEALRELALMERALRGDREAADLVVERAVTGEPLPGEPETVSLLGPDVLLEVARRRDRAEHEEPRRDAATRDQWRRESAALHGLTREYLRRLLDVLEPA